MSESAGKSGYEDMRLTYFNLKGRCEGIRFVLAVTGLPYKDIRIPLDGDEWQKLKPNTPFGRLPMLEVNGYKIGESAAIARFIARIGGLYGCSAEDQAVIDSIVDVCTEFREEVIRAFKTPGDQESKAALESYCNEEAQPLLRHLEAVLDSNGTDYFVCGKLSLADIWFMASMTTVVPADPEYLRLFPKLSALYDRVQQHSAIAEHIRNRPETMY